MQPANPVRRPRGRPKGSLSTGSARCRSRSLGGNAYLASARAAWRGIPLALARARFAPDRHRGAAFRRTVPGCRRRDDLARCIEEQPLPRVARVARSAGVVRWVRVLEAVGGMPTRVAWLARRRRSRAGRSRGRAQPLSRDAEVVELVPDHAAAMICAPVALPQAELDAEQLVVVAAGLQLRGPRRGGGRWRCLRVPEAR